MLEKPPVYPEIKLWLLGWGTEPSHLLVPWENDHSHPECPDAGGSHFTPQKWVSYESSWQQIKQSWNWV